MSPTSPRQLSLARSSDWSGEPVEVAGPAAPAGCRASHDLKHATLEERSHRFFEVPRGKSGEAGIENRGIHRPELRNREFLVEQLKRHPGVTDLAPNSLYSRTDDLGVVEGEDAFFDSLDRAPLGRPDVDAGPESEIVAANQSEMSDRGNPSSTIARRLPVGCQLVEIPRRRVQAGLLRESPSGRFRERLARSNQHAWQDPASVTRLISLVDEQDLQRLAEGRLPYDREQDHVDRQDGVGDQLGRRLVEGCLG